MAEPGAGQRYVINLSRNRKWAFFGDRGRLVKTIILALCLAIVAVGFGVLSINRMSALRDEQRAVKAAHVTGQQQIADLSSQLGQMFRGMLLYYVANSVDAQVDAKQEAGREAVRDADGNVDAALGVYTRLAAGSPVRLAAIHDFGEAIGHYRALRDTVLFGDPMAAGYRVPAVGDILPEFTDVQNAIATSVQTLQQAEDAEADRLARRTAAAYGHARTVALIALIIGLLIAVFVCVAVFQLIRPRLGTVPSALEAVAESDRSGRSAAAKLRPHDEPGGMAYAVSRTRDGLHGSALGLAAKAHTVGVGTQRLISRTARLTADARKAGEQVILAAVRAGNFSSSTRPIAPDSVEGAAPLRRVTRYPADATRAASRVIGDPQSTLDNVAKLNASTEDLDKVVNLIAKIAEQANVLARNASVEAARVAAASQGFAAAATEVAGLVQETPTVQAPTPEALTVQALAQERSTATAIPPEISAETDGISRRIEGIRPDRAGAFDAIGHVARLITAINAQPVTGAATPEKQAATTIERSRNVGHAATVRPAIAGKINSAAETVQPRNGAPSKADDSIGAVGTVNIERAAAAIERSAVAKALQAEFDALDESDDSEFELARQADEVRTLVGRFRV